MSDYLNKYKGHEKNEYLHPPKALDRGNIKTTDILEKSTSENECKELIRNWALEVYNKQHTHHALVDNIAKGFVNIK
ncbi:MAG: hypothetical protein RIE58_11900 [Vicingaceae bacterium]